MPDRETSVANFHESLLTAEMGPTDLTAVVDATSPLTSPTLVVIEPDEPTQREVILFDGSFTATQFATSDIANRYLEGSAAGSGLTHPIGSIVRSAPLAHHIIDLNDRIDARDHHAEDHAARHAPGGADALSFEVDGDTFVDSPVVGTGTWATLATVDLVIPATWGSWKCVAWASLAFDYNSNGGGGLFRIDIDGVDSDSSEYLTDSVALPVQVLARRTGITTTGTRTVTLEFSTNSPRDAKDIHLYARAVRTS